MKKHIKNKLFIIILLAFFITLAISFSSSSNAAYQNQNNIKMVIGEKYKIPNVSDIVSWSSSKSGVASVDKNGEITAIVANSSKVEITGFHSNGTKETFYVTVTTTPFSDTTSYTVSQNNNRNIWLSGNFENENFKIANTSIAEITYEGNNYIVIKGKMAGKTKLIATTETGTYQVDIIVENTFLFNKSTYIISRGDYEHLYLPSSFENYDWKITNPEIAELQLYSSSSMSARKVVGKKVGKTEVIVTNEYGQKAKATIQVTSEPFKFDNNDLSIDLEGYNYYNYLSLPSEYNVEECTYYFENASIATVSEAYNNTFYIKGLKNGDTNFVVKNKYGETAKAKIHIYTIPKNIVKLNQTEYTVYIGSTVKINCQTPPANYNCNLRYEITYYNNSGISISKTGVITPKKEGTYYVSVYCENTYVGECTIYVKAPYFSKKSYNVYRNKSIALSVVGKKAAIKFTSSNTSIATVDSNGNVRGKKAGTATITANINGYKFNTKIIVSNPKFTKSSITMYLNKKENLKIIGGTGKIKWKSSNPKIVKVSSTGKITGLKTGGATISATISGKTYKCKVKVKANTKSYKVTTDSSYYNYGNPVCKLSKVSLSGKTLIADVWIINPRMFTAKKFDYINFWIYDLNGKVIAYKRFKNVSLKIKPYSSKKIKLKFTGSSIKNKKAILNNGIYVYYNYIYTYNY